MSENVFLVFDKNAYFYPYENDCQMYIKDNVISKLFSMFYRKLKICYPNWIINKNIAKYSKVIVTDSSFNISAYLSLKRFFTEENIILYYMNPINESNISMMKYFKNVYTFDIEDSKKYCINFMHTPYSDKIKLLNKEIKYDTLFLGRAKGRINKILSLKKMLDEYKIKSKFLVLGTDYKEISIKSFLSYSSYLDMLSESKCVIEINQENQSGCSLRFLESLFLNKKLITDNIFIINDPYYNKNNVYVIDNDNRNINEFLSQAYDQRGKCLNNLIFENWIRKF